MMFIGIVIGVVVTLLIIGVVINVKYDEIANAPPKKIDFSNGVSIELRECPYCGENHEMLVESKDNGELVYAIRCNVLEGGCGSQTGFYAKPLDAILAWNMRSEEND